MLVLKPKLEQNAVRGRTDWTTPDVWSRVNRRDRVYVSIDLSVGKRQARLWLCVVRGKVAENESKILAKCWPRQCIGE